MLRRLALAGLLALWPALVSAQFAVIAPTPATSDNGDRIATTAWVNNFFALGIPLASGKIFIGSAGGVATAKTMAGDCTLIASGVLTCTQSAGNFLVNGSITVSGTVIDTNGQLLTNIVAPSTPAAGTTRVYVDSTQKVLTAKNDAGTVSNTVVPSTCSANQFGVSHSAAGVFACAQPAIANISGWGTGVATALGVNVGSAGAPVLFNGAGGTPSSLALANATGLPLTTGVTGTLPVANGGTGVTTGSVQLVTAPITVDFSVAGDNAITVPLPSGFTRIGFGSILISSASADISAANFGVFTTTSGGGGAIVTAATAITVTATADNTNNNYQSSNFTNVITESYTPSGGTVQFRVGTTAAAGRTAKVTMRYTPLP